MSIINNKWLVALLWLGVLFSCKKNHVEDLLLEKPLSKEAVFLHEKEMNSRAYNTTYNGVPPKRDLNDSVLYEKSFMFLKENATPLPLKSKYYYDEHGEFKVLFYEWNLAVPGLSVEKMDSIMATQHNKLQEYHKYYVEIAKQLAVRLGNPTAGNLNIEREKMEIMDFYKSNVEWDLEDKTVVLKLYWIPKPGYKIYKIFTTVYFK